MNRISEVFSAVLLNGIFEALIKLERTSTEQKLFLRWQFLRNSLSTKLIETPKVKNFTRYFEQCFLQQNFLRSNNY